MKPTLAGFLVFVRTTMGINTTVLPDDSAVIPMALGVALQIVNQALKAVGCGPLVAGVPQVSIYTLAVYNLAGSNIINYAQDLDGAAPVEGSVPPMAYFAYLRQKWNINGFVSGVIQSAGDEGTNESMVVQEAAKNFTLSDLQNLKDPYGRAYLAFAQRYGTLWGMT